MRRFIKCDDGGYVAVRHISRLFLVTDFSGKTEIKASVPGPGMPFTLCTYPAKTQAEMFLFGLVEEIEEENRGNRSR